MEDYDQCDGVDDCGDNSDEQDCCKCDFARKPAIYLLLCVQALSISLKPFCMFLVVKSDVIQRSPCSLCFFPTKNLGLLLCLT